MFDLNKKMKLGILPGIANLYVRIQPDLQNKLNLFIKEVSDELQSEVLEVFAAPAADTLQSAEKAYENLLSHEIDLLVVALAPYCPSGVLAPLLARIDTPILLWPVQSMYELEPHNYNRDLYLLNHGVHAVQDLANVLGKKGKYFGVIHGHLRQKEFVDELICFARAGRTIKSMRRAKPIQIGGHFEDMLDLQIGEDEFLKQMGLKPKIISLDEFASLMAGMKENEVFNCIKRYEKIFDFAEDVDDSLLAKTARGELSVRSVMTRENSFACGLNFLELCNDKRIADALHVVASMLMQEGLGYAGEGDWVTAAFVFGMQQCFGVAGFSEIFSVDYADNRLVLRHWGEGNFALAREKPRLLRSKLEDKHRAEFVMVDFEFEPGPVTLINLNSTPEVNGRLISFTGTITEDRLPKATGPRAIFKPASKDVRNLLTEYAYHGGSHHLVLIKGDGGKVLEKISKLTGWAYINLST